MLHTHILKYWLVAAVWFLVYVKADQTEDTSINLDDVPLANYTMEVKSITPTSLSGWYKMTDGFLSVVHSKSKETVDIIIKFVKGKKFEVPGSLFAMLKLQYAMFACVVIGLLFTIAMFVTGLIFFCCRMCGSCGGERVQVVTSTASVWRKFFILFLIIFLALLLPAVITMFIINSSLNSSFSETEKTVVTSLYDAEIFVNNTQNQVSYLAQTGVTKAVSGISMELDNVKTFVEGHTEGMSKSIDKAMLIPLLGWQNLSIGLEVALNMKEQIKLATLNVSNILASLRDHLNSLKERCGENCDKINSTIFTLNDNVIDNMGNLNETVVNLEKLRKEDYERIPNDVVKRILAIPSEIESETSSIRIAVKHDLKKFAMEVLTSEQLKKLENFTDLARNIIQKTRHQVQKTFPDARKYDSYRWYIGLGVSIVIAVVAGGLLLALLFGICGYRNDRQATKRTTMSNGAGLILMFTVYWMFFFSGFLMLITTLLFAVGGTVETYFCRPLFDQNFEFLDQVMDAIRHSALNESSILQNITPSDALRKCANNEAAYVAFNLEHMNITALFDYKEKLKLEQRLQELQNIKVPEVKFLTEHATDAIRTLATALNISVPDDVFEKLQENLTDGYKDQEQIISNITDKNAENIRQEIIEVGNITKNLEIARTRFGIFLLDMVNKSMSLKIGVIQLEKILQVLDEKFKNNMPVTVKTITKGFVEKLTDYGDSVIQSIITNLEKKLAPCKPLWNIFDSSRIVICKYYIQPLNGIWFAIGWSLFFFIPTIIVSTKLSKYFFKMSYTASDEKDEKGYNEMELTNGYKVKPDKGWNLSSHHL